MNSVNFYHLKKTNTYLALCKLLNKAIDQQNKILVRTDSKETSEEVDEYLWSYDPTSFVPHSKLGDHDNTHSPIFITHEMDNLNNACYLFILNTPNFSVSEIPHFQRTFILFSDADKDFMDTARKLWADTAAFDLERKYWVEEKKSWVLKMDA